MPKNAGSECIYASNQGCGTYLHADIHAQHMLEHMSPAAPGSAKAAAIATATATATASCVVCPVEGTTAIC